mgnify:CR=1 FL=1
MSQVLLTLGGVNMKVNVCDESPNGDQNKQKPNSPAKDEAKLVKKTTAKKATAKKKVEPKTKKKEKQTKSPAPSPEPVPAVVEIAKPEKPMSLKERLLAQKGKLDTATLGQKLTDKREVCGTPELMAEFADLISKADEIGVEHLSLDRPRHVAEREWFGQSLNELVSHLERLAQMDEDVAKLYGALQDYLQNAFIGDTFWRVICQIVRPFAKVASNGELQRQLNKLVNDGLVERDPGRYDNEAVLVFIGPTKFVYAPKRERNSATGQWELIPILKMGWQFVKAAAIRAREGSNQRWRELKALRDKATINAKEALKKKDGTFYIQRGNAAGILMKQKDGELFVLEVIGLRAGKLPSGPISWDDPAKNWPSPEVYFAFYNWKAYVERKLMTNE